MAKIDREYYKLLNKIIQEGYTYDDPNRKGVKRLEIISYNLRHEFKDGFPALTTKKLSYKNVVTELLWFLRGDTNIKYLLDNGCNIWNKDGFNYYKKKGGYSNYENWLEQVKGTSKYGKDFGQPEDLGDLGKIYSHQWRNSNGVDQIQKLITNLKEKPLATDHIVSSWNAGDLQDMALPPCHDYFQIVVRPLTKIERVSHSLWNYMIEPSDEELDKDNCPKYGFELHWHQRSVDTFLGLPYNIASYATLALILEKITGYKALAIQGDLKNVHLYDNSLDAVREQLERDPYKYKGCELDISPRIFNGRESLDAFVDNLQIEDFQLKNYESYPHLKVEMLSRNNEE